jgi:hypothetical protein
VIALFFVLLPTAAASTSAAHLTVPSLSPVVVRGTGFRANERITLTVSSKSTRTSRLTANRFGKFRATLRGFSIEHCEMYSVRAKGSRGSRVFFRVIPECASPGPSG